MFLDKLSDGAVVAEIVYGLILVVILISALVARRRAPRGTTFRYATIWVAIAAGLLVAYGLKDEALRLGRALLGAD